MMGCPVVNHDHNIRYELFLTILQQSMIFTCGCCVWDDWGRHGGFDEPPVLEDAGLVHAEAALDAPRLVPVGVRAAGRAENRKVGSLSLTVVNNAGGGQITISRFSEVKSNCEP